MKKLSILFAAVGLLFGLNLSAQTQHPDQNPNYKMSADKYALQSDGLLNNQGETIQDTYQAFDWSEHKAAKKQARIDNRQAVRLAYANSYYARPYAMARPYYSTQVYRQRIYSPRLYCPGTFIGLSAHNYIYH